MSKRVFDPQTREIITIDENAEPGRKDKYYHWSGVPFEKTPEIARAHDQQAEVAVEKLSDEDLESLKNYQPPVGMDLELLPLEQIQQIYDTEVWVRPSNKKNDKAWLIKGIKIKREAAAE